MEDEAAALVDAPDTYTWLGRRDRLLLRVALATGLRNSELTSLERGEVKLGASAHVQCLGKGRKMRCTPLRPDVAEDLRTWFASQGDAAGGPVFPSLRGTSLSPDAVQRRVARHETSAAAIDSSPDGRTITPHTLRHTLAMDLLGRGVDVTVLAPGLGHESPEPTKMYVHADMRLKERALAHANPSGTVPDRFRRSDSLIAFPEAL